MGMGISDSGPTPTRNASEAFPGLIHFWFSFAAQGFHRFGWMFRLTIEESVTEEHPMPSCRYWKRKLTHLTQSTALQALTDKTASVWLLLVQAHQCQTHNNNKNHSNKDSGLEDWVGESNPMRWDDYQQTAPHLVEPWNSLDRSLRIKIHQPKQDTTHSYPASPMLQSLQDKSCLWVSPLTFHLDILGTPLGSDFSVFQPYKKRKEINDLQALNSSMSWRR